ncbi:MAG: acyl-CoA thioesterase [Flavobacteriales bacterium]|nr:acyl-CoA thioesterase [Flavobacteriales bacterium]
MRTKTPIQVRFHDIDMAHHVHNAVYLSYFELARMDFLRQFIEKDHDWKKFGLILARNEVDYRQPVHLSDQVEVETWCSNVGNKSFDLSYALFVKQPDGRKLCTQGRSVMVCFDYVAGTSISVPDAWRIALARLMENDA